MNLSAPLIRRPIATSLLFALSAQRNDGMSPREAIRAACLLRFRPIMMTTFSALFGSLPSKQWLTLYTTPVAYLYLDRLPPGSAACTASRGSPRC